MAHELMFMQIYAIIHINAVVLLIYFFSFNVPPEWWQGGRQGKGTADTLGTCMNPRKTVELGTVNKMFRSPTGVTRFPWGWQYSKYPIRSMVPKGREYVKK